MANRSRGVVRRPLAVSRLVSLVTLVLVAGCTGTGTVKPSASAPIPTPSTTPSSGPVSAIVGDWTRVQSCQQQFAAFEAAGLAATHATSITDNWYAPGASAPTSGDLCAEAKPPVKHSHFFTVDGQFGSRDENGQQVDDGDYRIVDSDTLAFPSHAQEFNYAGDLLVDCTIDGDTATFRVTLPADCTGACADAYAWALSAFFGPTPWSRRV